MKALFEALYLLLSNDSTLATLLGSADNIYFGKPDDGVMESVRNGTTTAIVMIFASGDGGVQPDRCGHPDVTAMFTIVSGSHILNLEIYDRLHELTNTKGLAVSSSNTPIMVVENFQQYDLDIDQLHRLDVEVRIGSVNSQY